MNKLCIVMLLTTSVFAQSKKPQKETPYFIPDHGTSTSVVAQFAKGPLVEIITIENGKPTELLRIKDADGKLLITVHMDGSVTTSDGFKADDTAKTFWKAMADFYPKVCEQAK